MKKHTIFLAVLVFGFSIFAQEIQHEAVAVNIEVPVRVFKGNSFIENLTIDDFEVYEDGVLQKVEAVYLIKKMNVELVDTVIDETTARKIYVPDISRQFVFLFEIHEYLPKIGQAIEYFFNEIYVEGDELTVLTPLRTYLFNYEALEMLSTKEITQELVRQLRSDTIRSNAEYRALLRDLEAIKAYERSAIEGKQVIDVKDQVKWVHTNIVTRLRSLRYIDENKLLEFVEGLKRAEGPKHVFLFLQKLNIPIIRYNPIFGAEDLDEFEAYMALDESKIKQIFSDSSITAHMIYVTKLSDLDIMEGERSADSLTNRSVLDGSRTTMPRVIQDISANMFSAFGDIAETTGGTIDSSTNAAASFKKAADASENYYLLYYSPKNYVADGKFKEIKVRVKGQRYRITHRAGYIAD